MIRNLLLDLDDTLLDFRREERTALTRTLTRLGLTPTPAMLARYSAINLAQWKLLEQGILTRDQVKVRRYQLLFAEYGCSDRAAEATALYEQELTAGHFRVPGALTFLREAARNYRLYVISNGAIRVQESRMKNAGIDGFFTDVFLSEALGANKPQAAFFDRCFARIPDFKKDESLVIGDSLTSDIRGGHDAGVRTIWFHPPVKVPASAEKKRSAVPGKEAPPSAKAAPSAAALSANGTANTDRSPLPDYTVTALRDLLPLIRSL